MNDEPWTEQRIIQMISDGIEESLHLDYKASGSIAKTPQRREEILKDVTAFANSDGGLLIYGVTEYDDLERRHLPWKIDPIDRTQYSKEWLEHVISNAAPRIPGVKIYPIPLASDGTKVIYVVEVPRGTTAHQSKDGRYYRRFNFESTFMADHEIRDVMGRMNSIEIEVEAYFGLRDPWEESNFLIRLKNTGKRGALRYSCLVRMPLKVGGTLVGVEGEGVIESNEDGHFMEFSLGQDLRAVPLFPKSEHIMSKELRADVRAWKDIKTGKDFVSSELLELVVYADEMPPIHAKFKPADLLGNWGKPLEFEIL